MTKAILYSYFRSSTSLRVRVALNLKGIAYDQHAVHLRKGEQRDAEFLALNPQGLVPALVFEDGTTLTQSLAVMEYLDEMYPEPPILPADSKAKVRVRALAYAIACEIHPLNNLRILKFIHKNYSVDDQGTADWFCHWVTETFGPVETLLSESNETGLFCHGDTPSIADICLFAQVINNRRFDVDMSPYPTLSRIFEQCMLLPAFESALPQHQPDAE